jgi:hypothetical protein
MCWSNPLQYHSISYYFIWKQDSCINIFNLTFKSAELLNFYVSSRNQFVRMSVGNSWFSFFVFWNILYIAKFTHKNCCHFLRPLWMCKMLKSWVVIWRYLRYEQHQFTWNCKCFSYVLQYRPRKMAERRQWYDFTHTVSVSRADMIFLWEIQKSSGSWRGSGGGWVGWSVSDGFEYPMWLRKAKGFFWFLDWTGWICSELEKSSYRYWFLVGQGWTYFSTAREIMSCLSVSFGKFKS